MQFFTIAFPMLAAVGSLAAPQAVAPDNSIRVILQDLAADLGSQTSFEDNGLRQTLPPVGSSGPFSIVELSLGPDVSQQGLRCQIRDENNDAIRVLRGPNDESNDTSFADADGGVWRFDAGPQFVSAVICDPDFVKNEVDLEIRVTLSDGNLATQTVFLEAGLVAETQEPVGSSGPFNTVNLDIGADVKQQTLRCQILDNDGNAIEIKRGENEDFTFADGGKGLWNFLNPTSSEVSQIICDPAFVSA